VLYEAINKNNDFDRVIFVAEDMKEAKADYPDSKINRIKEPYAEEAITSRGYQDAR